MGEGIVIRKLTNYADLLENKDRLYNRLEKIGRQLKG